MDTKALFLYDFILPSKNAIGFYNFYKMTKAKLLIVEDDPIIAEGIINCVKKFGFEVSDSVSSGEDAIESAKKNFPDLILMDIFLRGKRDGIETAGQMQLLYDIPVIYITAYSDKEMLERAKATAPFGYIIKPFKDRELYTAIEIALYRHKTEKKIRENEKWVSTILSSIGDAVIASDINGNITFMNPVACNLTGWQPDDVIGKPLNEIFDIVDEETKEPAESPVTKVLRDGSVAGLANHTLLRTRTGREIPIDDSVSPIKDEKGNIIGVVLIFRDISGKRRTEKALQESEERLRLIIENSEDMICLHDPDGKYLYYHGPSRYGVQKESMKGKTPADLFDDHDAEPIMEQIKKVASDGESISAENHVNWNGEILWFEDKISPVRDRDNNIKAVVKICRNITERKKVEEELRKVHDNLESEVKRRTLELVRTNERLICEIQERKKAEEEKERLLYTLKERVKELNCLFNISKIIEQRDMSSEEILKSLILFIPQAWQHPDMACARIIFEDNEFKSENFQSTEWRQITDIKVFGKKKGKIEICYLEKAGKKYGSLFLKEERNLIDEIAIRLGKLFERRYAEQDVVLYQAHLRALSSQLLLTEERERQRIATELHDRIGQSLAISKLNLGFMRNLATSPELVKSIDDMCSLLSQIIQDTRSLTFEISPPVLYKLGLESAIEWLAEQIRQQHGIQIEFEDDRQPKPLNDAFRVLIFRATRELLMNIVKHSKAQHAKISVKREGDNIRIEIEDDGIGFQLSDINNYSHGNGFGGFGLFSVRERLSDLGGDFEVRSEPGKGTRIKMLSPLNHK